MAKERMRTRNYYLIENKNGEGIFRKFYQCELTIGLQGFKALLTKFRTVIDLSDGFQVYEKKKGNVRVK